MLLKRCNQCKKMYWRNVGPSGYCASCHEKMRRATGASSPRTNAAIRSVDSPSSRSDDWPHNHSRYALYDDAPTHHHSNHCDTSSHHSSHDSGHSSSFDSGSCSYDSGSDSSGSSWSD